MHTLTWTLGKHPKQLYIFRVDVKDPEGNLLGYSSRWTDDLCQ